jgi:hypothetical protein
MLQISLEDMIYYNIRCTLFVRELEGYIAFLLL